MIEQTYSIQERLRKRAHEMYERRKSAVEQEKSPELTVEEERIREEIQQATSARAQTYIDDQITEETRKLLNLDERTQLSELVTLAFTKGVVFALRVAKALKNPLVLDTFHDLLAQDNNFRRLIQEKRI